MSGANASLQWSVDIKPDLRSLVYHPSQLQCHVIPVRVHLYAKALTGVLRSLGGTRYRIELLPGARLHGQGALSKIGVSFVQHMGRHAAAVWFALESFDLDQGHFVIEAERPQPLFLESRSPVPFQPLAAVARSPVFFSRSFELTVTRLTPLYGEFCVLNNETLLPIGIDLELNLLSQWTNNIQVGIQILGLYTQDGYRSYYFRTLDRRSDQAIASFLLCRSEHFAFDNLPRWLRNDKRVAALIRTEIVSTPKRLQQALLCRLLANQHYGRLDKTESPESLWDRYDPYAIHVIASIGNKGVGAARVVLNEGHRDRCEIEQATPLPEWLWTAGFVEISRVAIRPEYAGRWVMLSLLRELGRIILNLGYRYIMLDAIEVLVPLYTRLGARCLPITKQHPYSGETVHIMYFDIGASLASFDSKLLYWLFVFSPTIRHTIRTENMGAFVRHFKLSPLRLWLKKGLAHATKKILA